MVSSLSSDGAGTGERKGKGNEFKEGLSERKHELKQGLLNSGPPDDEEG